MGGRHLDQLLDSPNSADEAVVILMPVPVAPSDTFTNSTVIRATREIHPQTGISRG